MVQRCAACGFAAETRATLPKPWVAYLVTEQQVEVPEEEVTIPVCLGCQQTIETFLDPQESMGGTDPDTAVRTFLEDLEFPQDEDGH